MLDKDIKIINDFLADLAHYNKNVAECWYRVRDLVERINTAVGKPIPQFDEKLNARRKVERQLEQMEDDNEMDKR